MEAVTPQPVCAKEALALLNCTVETPFDRDKCLRLLDSLRSCVLEKKVKKFSVVEQSHAARLKPSEGKTEGGCSVFPSSKASKKSRNRATKEKVERFRGDRGLGDQIMSVMANVGVTRGREWVLWMRRMTMRGEGCLASASASMQSGPHLIALIHNSYLRPPTTLLSATTDVVSHHQLEPHPTINQLYYEWWVYKSWGPVI
ncbi:hypothetical protein C4D60_Mb03t03220 [Musa balbisiana]|uniref:CHCH domain-containing protein n=1 Tax=Musa balbisiana TaxID=52838 RepID=A0A4S8J765_MUSBA|nr:hypothetical protein C4D60_Mb03t03220 [Musa balbisiana]